MNISTFKHNFQLSGTVLEEKIQLIKLGNKDYRTSDSRV